VTGYQPRQRRIYNHRLEFKMTGVIAKRQWVEDWLLNLRQGGRHLEKYAAEFIELSHQMGLDENIIRCSFPVCDFSLIELINLILYLNGSNIEIEEGRKIEFQSRPVPSETHVTLPAHPMLRSSTCRATDLSHPSKIFCGHKWGPYNANLGSKLVDPAITSVQSALKSASRPLKPVHVTSAAPRLVHTMSVAPSLAHVTSVAPSHAHVKPAAPGPAHIKPAFPDPVHKIAAQPEHPAAMADGREGYLARIQFPHHGQECRSMRQRIQFPRHGQESAVHESSQVRAVFPASRQVRAALPKASQVKAVVPESSKVAALFPESSQVSESNQVTAELPEPNQVTAELPEPSQVTVNNVSPDRSSEPAPPKYSPVTTPPEPAPPEHLPLFHPPGHPPESTAPPWLPE
ncbi:hypothetical protein M9458_055786, partial [Cirrhinus mrigala]